MTDQRLVDIGTKAMIVAAKLSAPMLLTALAVGFLISLFQSVTQIQDSTLSFVPKVVAVGVALLFAGNWMVHEMVSFTSTLFETLPAIIRGG